jgi:type II secretory pathway pseudopilin PulG
MKKGYTLVELVTITALILVLFSVLLVNFDVFGNKKKARDVKRLSDMALLDRVISEYQVDNKVYPDMEGVLRISTVLPGGSSRLENTTSGWIDENLANYTSKLPVDPVNDGTYFYSYIHDNSGYELNARLEAETGQMQNDGGNDPALYETGSNLLLISP